MKRLSVCLVLLCCLTFLFPAYALGGYNTLSDEVLEALNLSLGDSYVIPNYTRGTEIEDVPASKYYDEYGHAAACVYLRTGGENKVCLLEKRQGIWEIVHSASRLVYQQGERVPVITSEVYGEFHVSYIAQTSHVEESLLIARGEHEWYVAEYELVDFENDQNIFIRFDENGASYRGNFTQYQPVKIRGKHVRRTAIEDFDIQSMRGLARHLIAAASR